MTETERPTLCRPSPAGNPDPDAVRLVYANRTLTPAQLTVTVG